MVPREILRSPRFLVPSALALGALLALLLLAVTCHSEARLRQRVQTLEREKKAAETSAARFKAESRAKAQYLDAITNLLNQVGNRIDQIQQDQKGLTALAVQRGDTRRMVENKDIPQALDRIDDQLHKNREQIGQLEALIARQSTENQGLKTWVGRLKNQNEGLDQQLQALRRSFGALSRQVKTLETKVVKLEGVVDEKEKVIDDKEKVIEGQTTQITEQAQKLEAAEAGRWTRSYVVGTKKELCGLSLIAPCKLFGALRLADRHVDAFAACGDRCPTVDVRSLQEIPLEGTRDVVKILPPRPAGSYTVLVREGARYLVIDNPEEFWRSSFYLVVVVEKRGS